MYIIHLCSLNDTVYDSKINLSEKEKICQKYNLQHIGEIKDYWKNNVCILFSKSGQTFTYITDNHITYNENVKYLLQNVDSQPCKPFQFYNVDHEELYDSYETYEDDIKIQLKVYSTYCTLQYQSEDLNKLKNIDIFLY